MSKEEDTKATRRTTRSSSAAVLRDSGEIKKKCGPHIPTFNDLVFGEDNISKEDLLSNFPGRHTQILELLNLLGPLNSPMLPLFVYGGTSTGKTSVILQIFRHLNRPFVYSSCRTCYSLRTLFESILNQLLLHEKDADNGYLSAKRCEKTSDFVNSLREALVKVVKTLQGNPGKIGTKKLTGQGHGHMIYLIFDNLELVRDWDKSSSILPFLFNLHEVLNMNEVGFLFISNTSPDTYYSNMGYLDPIPVYFSEYTEDDLRKIFIRNQTNQEMYSSFLSVVLGPFYRITRHVNELSIAFSSLYKTYCEASDDLNDVPNESSKRARFSRFQPHISPALNQIFKISSPPSEVNNLKEAKRKAGSKKFGGCDSSEHLDFHMSTSAKYLLLSAFLASRNPATLDASLFDSTGGSSSRKRKKRPSEKSIEQKEICEQELLMKGPGTFPLERLLAIFQCITSVAEISLEDDQGNVAMDSQNEDSELMSDVLLQLSSLCNANFVVKGGSCPLEGSTRYRSTVSEDMALKVARSIKFPLSKYMYRR
ncbi:origin of replication complex subunit 5 [Cucumis sativus]|uniref:Uncharacterized protein n=1 Tax=Cucumis sativus TaxID=3659 RepID=A0A0A0KD06_CUCSA|nr:origin of replication complex subunit 5 [Cucumis sativus]XP_011656341.1 origin of replication complex subunit 5 [Cucumis sativus]XP_031743682.1 origin of replication complex subunit 5 [Cucumis sativus]